MKPLIPVHLKLERTDPDSITRDIIDENGNVIRQETLVPIRDEEGKITGYKQEKQEKQETKDEHEEEYEESSISTGTQLGSAKVICMRGRSVTRGREGECNSGRVLQEEE